jgi:ABC-type antimicrobial peptide transport system permease subunit
MKGLKTYLTFLHRNKLFTVVNVAGLSISLMFVLLIADMVTRQLSVDKNLKDTDRISVFASENTAAGHYLLGEKLQSRYPEIEEWCAYTGNFGIQTSINENPTQIRTLVARKNFFQFFGYKLAEGNPAQVLVDDHSIVLSRSCANRLFGNEAALGKVLELNTPDSKGSGNQKFTVTGIMEDIENSLIKESTEAIIPYENINELNPTISLTDGEMGNATSALVFFRTVKGSDLNTKAKDALSYLKDCWWIYNRGIFKKVQFVPYNQFYFHTETPSGSTEINQYSFRMVVLFLVTGIIILFMAIFNYVNMSIAQTTYRAKEMATRKLLGSSRSDIFWRMIGESSIMTVIAFILGFLLAKAAEPIAMDLLGVKLDLTGDLSFMTCLSYLLLIVLLSFISGFVPATILSNYNPLDVVKGHFRRKTKAVYLRVLNIVDCRYLEVMGIRIVEGRRPKPGDEDVYIFNEFTRKKYPWLKVDQPAPDDNLVIGFCENIKYSSFRNDDTNQTMAFLIPGKKFAQWGWEWRNFVNVRISAGADKVEVIRSLQKTMEKFTPGHDFNFRFMDEVLDANYRNELRFTKQILLFSLIAIAISLTGVFGLTMFESEYRKKEIGIRKIMGSSTTQILYMFNRRYILILAGCFIVAAPFGWWIGQHWLQGFAEKTPVTPWIFILSFLLVTLITMITITVQSWKNANENPANSIKTE